MTARLQNCLYKPHSEDFTRIYYFQNNIELPAPIIFQATKNPNKTREWQNFDLLLMEKTPYTLDGILNKLPDNYHLSLNVLNCLLMSLIRMCNSMVEAGYYYTDLKPANIGIVKYNNVLTFKLILPNVIDGLADELFFEIL